MHTNTSIDIRATTTRIPLELKLIDVAIGGDAEALDVESDPVVSRQQK